MTIISTREFNTVIWKNNFTNDYLMSYNKLHNLKRMIMYIVLVMTAIEEAVSIPGLCSGSTCVSGA